jgi:putative tricarboxylic transport membrane protein
MLAGIYYGSMYGGSTTSILMRIPGEAASVITIIDGYEMAKRGRAGAALAVSAVGSFVAGTVGLVALMFAAPLLASWALAFGPSEYFMVALLGLVALSRLSSGSLWRGLLMLAFGLALTTVGSDTVSGTNRYTFGWLQLAAGIDLIPVVIGLYGLAEVMLVAERSGGLPRLASFRYRELFPTRQEWRRAGPAIVRGSGLGFLIGLIPGPANVISSFASYNLERRISPRQEEFGRGAIEGVAGPESANNAATSGQMVPLLALGIPFSAASGILLAALIVQGVQPGPLLYIQHPDVFWGVIASMYVGNAALLVLNLPLIGVWVSVLRLPQSVLLAVITVMMFVGAYAVRNSLFDLGVLIVAGVVGYLLRKMQFDLAPLVLALVLGPFLERTLRQSLFLSRGDLTEFVARPITVVLFVSLLVVVLLPPVFARIRGRVLPALPNNED